MELKRLLSNTKGLTLVEVLIALAIMGLALGGLMDLMINMKIRHRSNAEFTQAIALSEEKLNIYLSGFPYHEDSQKPAYGTAYIDFRQPDNPINEDMKSNQNPKEDMPDEMFPPVNLTRFDWMIMETPVPDSNNMRQIEIVTSWRGRNRPQTVRFATQRSIGVK